MNQKSPYLCQVFLEENIQMLVVNGNGSIYFRQEMQQLIQ